MVCDLEHGRRGRWRRRSASTPRHPERRCSQCARATPDARRSSPAGRSPRAATSSPRAPRPRGAPSTRSITGCGCRPTSSRACSSAAGLERVRADSVRIDDPATTAGSRPAAVVDPRTRALVVPLPGVSEQARRRIPARSWRQSCVADAPPMTIRLDFLGIGAQRPARRRCTSTCARTRSCTCPRPRSSRSSPTTRRTRRAGTRSPRSPSTARPPAAATARSRRTTWRTGRLGVARRPGERRAW